jgi:hypothetical protein
MKKIFKHKEKLNILFADREAKNKYYENKRVASLKKQIYLFVAFILMALCTIIGGTYAQLWATGTTTASSLWRPEPKYSVSSDKCRNSYYKFYNQSSSSYLRADGATANGTAVGIHIMVLLLKDEN